MVYLHNINKQLILFYTLPPAQQKTRRRMLEEELVLKWNTREEMFWEHSPKEMLIECLRLVGWEGVKGGEGGMG